MAVLGPLKGELSQSSSDAFQSINVLTCFPLLVTDTLMVHAQPEVILGLMLLISPHVEMVLHEVETTGTHLVLHPSTRTLMETLQLVLAVLEVQVVPVALVAVLVKLVVVEMDNGEMENTLLDLPTLV